MRPQPESLEVPSEITQTHTQVFTILEPQAHLMNPGSRYLPSMVLGWAVKTDGSTTKRVLSTIRVTLSPSLGPLRWPSLLLRSDT